MWQKVFSAICASCFCWLAACSSLPSGDASPAVAEAPAEIAAPPESVLPSDDPGLLLEVIAFAQHMTSVSADEQRQEMSMAAKAFARDRSAVTRLRYGVLLSLPTLVGADAQRSLAILEPLTTGSSGQMRQFATLIVLQINERLKEQRRTQQFREQLDESRASERVANERALQLKIQLDELRAIERALLERGRPKK